MSRVEIPEGPYLLQETVQTVQVGSDWSDGSDNQVQIEAEELDGWNKLEEFASCKVAQGEVL